MKVTITSLLVVLMTTILGGQNNTTLAPAAIEITQQDFTKVERLRSSNLMVFGVQLGQTEEKAEAAVKSAGLSWVKLPSGNAAIRDANGKWLVSVDVAKGEIVLLILESVIVDYMKGDSKKLFSPTVIEQQSSHRLALMGHEDQREEDPLFHTVKYSYFKEGIAIQALRPLDPPPIRIWLFLPAKSR